MSLGLAAGLALVSTPPAKAGDPGLGAYMGGAIGEAWVETGDRTLSGTSIAAFKENHTAYELMAGVRPISLLGAEIAYVEFGHPHQTRPVGDAISADVSLSADVRMKGAAAFGVLYLPVRVVDVYVKAGLSRIQTTANVAGVRAGVATCAFNAPDCALFRAHGSTTDTHFAAGAGAQLELGSWALRAEYERFDAAGGNPGLATVGVTWTFL
jgi:opacity protein-like surface antigen